VALRGILEGIQDPGRGKRENKRGSGLVREGERRREKRGCSLGRAWEREASRGRVGQGREIDSCFPRGEEILDC